MRCMIIVKASKNCEAGVMPTQEALTKMGKFNEALAKAGLLLALDGLQPSSNGARVGFSGSGRTVTDGPFAETKELISGFWVWQVKSREEAVEWAKRIPFEDGEVEIRPLYEAERFGSAFKPELGEQEERISAQTAVKRSA